MYLYLKGILTASSHHVVTLEVQGVGYGISIPSHVYQALPQIGSPLLLYTSFVLREFSQTLYGFLSPQERDLFEIVMQVSGIGPKTALSMIGHLSGEELRRAVVEEEIPLLCKVPGIGRKTAERLALELKDKLSQRPDLFPKDPPSFSHPQAKKVQDATSALVNLGYPPTLAQKAVKTALETLPQEIDLPSLITWAIRHCSADAKKTPLA